MPDKSRDRQSAARKVTPVVRNVVDIEHGSAYLNIDTEGDVFIETPGSTLMVMGKDEVADLTAVIRSYLAYIDGEDAPTEIDDDAHEEVKPYPAATPTPQVGDWVEVLKDGADNSGIMAGVHEVLGDAITPGSVEVYDRRCDATWYISPENYRLLRHVNEEAANA
jgi:hypothetical protein